MAYEKYYPEIILINSLTKLHRTRKQNVGTFKVSQGLYILLTLNDDTCGK